jgi:hypothetical protein
MDGCYYEGIRKPLQAKHYLHQQPIQTRTHYEAITAGINGCTINGLYK